MKMNLSRGGIWALFLLSLPVGGISGCILLTLSALSDETPFYENRFYVLMVFYAFFSGSIAGGFVCCGSLAGYGIVRLIKVRALWIYTLAVGIGSGLAMAILLLATATSELWLIPLSAFIAVSLYRVVLHVTRKHRLQRLPD